MSKSNSAKFRKYLLTLVKDPEALIAAAMEEHEARVDAENKLHEIQKGAEALSREYHRKEMEHDKLVQMIPKLERTIADLYAQLTALKRDCYGRKAETCDALGGLVTDENTDPLSEDAVEPDPSSKKPPRVPRNFNEAARQLAKGKPEDEGKKGNGEKGNGVKEPKKPRQNKGLRASLLARLPHQYDFDFNIDLLDDLYGQGEWSIIGLHKSETVEHQPETRYVHCVFRPVIKLKNDRIIAPEMPEKFYSHSLLSASLLSDLFDKRLNLSLPVYRLLHYTSLGDLGITDTTMYKWFTQFTQLYLKPVYDYLTCLLMAVPYQQCDETFWMVIRDGRKAGSKSFMWVHVTSELWDGPRIVIIEYEKTRGTDHLRKFYRYFKGNIGCDAFAAYFLLEKENPDSITISGCMMHVRRRFFNALLILLKTAESEDTFADSPEGRALLLIMEIYTAENQLKDLSADERLKRRQAEVKPTVDKFYDFVRSLDPKNPALSDKMRDAITYALNHEREIRRFLDDGNIAIDNGHCERAIKPIALARRNSLFSTSIEGAESLSIGLSLVETARASGAKPYWYFRYIFEELPGHLKDPNKDWLADFVPWSAKYRAYEETHCMKVPDMSFSEYMEKPWKVWKQSHKKNCA